MKNELLWLFRHDVFISLCVNKGAENEGFGQVYLGLVNYSL